DPILLAAAVPARPGQRALDLGCGAGAAMLCLAARAPEVRALGVEIQPPLLALAQANIAANELTARVSAEVGDIAALPARLHGAFDQVLMSPPFMPAGAGTLPPDPSRALAHG